MAFFVQLFGHEDLHREQHSMDAVDAIRPSGHFIVFPKLLQELNWFLLPDKRDRSISVKCLVRFLGGCAVCNLVLVQTGVGQCLVKSSAVHAVSW